jgi:hypothetical protein
MLLCILIVSEIFGDADIQTSVEGYPLGIWIVVARFIAGVVLHMSL